MGWPKGKPRKTAGESPNSQFNRSVAVADNPEAIAGLQHEVEAGAQDRLFPELIPEGEVAAQEEVKEEVKEQEASEPKPEESQESEAEVKEEAKPEAEVKPAEASEKKILNVDEFGDYIVVQKINGQTREIKLRDLNRIDQTDKAITERAQRLADERKRLEEMRKSVAEKTREEHAVPSDDNPLAQEVQSLKQALAQIMQVQQPVLHEAAQKRVADELKADGFDDFLDYIPRIKQELSHMDDDKALYYDTPQGAKEIYMKMKLKDVQQSSKSQKLPETPKAPPVHPKPPQVKPSIGNNASTLNKTDDLDKSLQEILTKMNQMPFNSKERNRLAMDYLKLSSRGG